MASQGELIVFRHTLKHFNLQTLSSFYFIILCIYHSLYLTDTHWLAHNVLNFAAFQNCLFSWCRFMFSLEQSGLVIDFNLKLGAHVKSNFMLEETFTGKSHTTEV